MNLPTQYQWLTRLRGLPNTIKEGLKLYGTKEVVGRGSNRTILGWRDELNGATTNGKPIVVGFSDDDIPWCGLFAAIVAYRRMLRIGEVVASPLWARNWAKYGVKSLLPSLGDVLVFSRGSGGHVGFYIGEDSSCYHVLGGNQSNAVTITRILKSRLLACRRPPYVVTPSACKPFKLAATGGVSVNEA
jgi:uncharacterized protein (TIGR02594 family)